MDLDSIIEAMAELKAESGCIHDCVKEIKEDQLRQWNRLDEYGKEIAILGERTKQIQEQFARSRANGGSGLVRVAKLIWNELKF